MVVARSQLDTGTIYICSPWASKSLQLSWWADLVVRKACWDLSIKNRSSSWKSFLKLQILIWISRE